MENKSNRLFSPLISILSIKFGWKFGTVALWYILTWWILQMAQNDSKETELKESDMKSTLHMTCMKYIGQWTMTPIFSSVSLYSTRHFQDIAHFNRILPLSPNMLKFQSATKFFKLTYKTLYECLISNSLLQSRSDTHTKCRRAFWHFQTHKQLIKH